MLVDLAGLERAYYDRRPEPEDPAQRVRFGTNGHRGSPFHGSFTEAHIVAITQAICDYRRERGIDGPLYLGKDTHGVSRPAERTALEVLAANGVNTIIQRDDGVTPTPVISRAILVYNRGRAAHLADGIIVTPSHNAPEDGGFKYNPPTGKRVELPFVAIVQFEGDKIAHEHLYWDQASVLVQVGLLDRTLPVRGGEIAAQVLSPSQPMNELIQRAEASGKR